MATSKKRLADIIRCSSLKAVVSLEDHGDAVQEKQIRILPQYSRVKCNAYITTETELRKKRILIQKHLNRLKKNCLYFTSLLDCWFGVYIIMDNEEVYLIHPSGLYHGMKVNFLKEKLVPKVDLYSAIENYKNLFPRLLS